MRSTFQPFNLGTAALANLADSKPLTSYRLECVSLKKRAVTEVVCGLYVTADIGDNGRNLSNLDDTGGQVDVAAQSCNRIGCYSASGVYVWYDGDEHITVEMFEAMTQMRYSMSVCIGGNSIGKDTVSGRVKVDTNEGWNLNIEYCNGSFIWTSQYSDGWPGLNGNPDVICGREDEAACEGDFCKKNSVVIESQDTVTCDSYHAGSYAGPGSTVVYNSNRQSSTPGTSVAGWESIPVTSPALQAMEVSAADFPKQPPLEAQPVSARRVVEPTWRATLLDLATNERVSWANVAPQVAEDGIGVHTSETCTCGECPDADNPGAPDLSELECTAECL